MLIHSKQDTLDEILAFCGAWPGQVPLGVPHRRDLGTDRVVPTDDQAHLPQRGHSAKKAAGSWSAPARFRRILADGGIAGVEGSIASVAEVFALQGDPRLRELDRAYLRILPRRRVHPCPAPNSLR